MRDCPSESSNWAASSLFCVTGCVDGVCVGVCGDPLPPAEDAIGTTEECIVEGISPGVLLPLLLLLLVDVCD